MRLAPMDLQSRLKRNWRALNLEALEANTLLLRLRLADIAEPKDFAWETALRCKPGSF